jgi:hypothetical protein
MAVCYPMVVNVKPLENGFFHCGMIYKWKIVFVFSYNFGR